MLINLRNALMGGKRLPYDAEVEYLESTGTQYIDTGVYGDSDTVAELSFAMTDNSRADAGIFGARKGYLQDCFAIMRVASSSGAFWMHYGNERTSANYISTVIGNTTAWHTARLARSWSIDTSTGTAGQYTFTTPTTLKVFAADISASGRWYAKMRLTSLKIYDSNATLVRDYIPVRVGTTGYLYDRVSGALFGNAGTGDFVVGQDVVPATWVDGECWDTYGTAQTLSGASRCENFLPVEPSSTVTFYLGYRPGGTTLYMVQYNSGKLRIYSTYNSNGSARTVTIPANCYYIRVSAETIRKDEAYVHDDTNDRDLLRNGMIPIPA